MQSFIREPIGDGNSIEVLYKTKKEELDAYKKRHCWPQFTVIRAPFELGVIGRVIHLAQVESIEASIIISWHIRNHLFSIVTNSIEKSKQLVAEDTEVCLLHAIIDDQMKHQLPHEKCTIKFEPIGNPRWAVSYL